MSNLGTAPAMAELGPDQPLLVICSKPVKQLIKSKLLSTYASCC